MISLDKSCDTSSEGDIYTQTLQHLFFSPRSANTGPQQQAHFNMRSLQTPLICTEHLSAWTLRMSLISIKRVEVPEYLHSSAFYQSLSCDDEDVFTIPQANFKENVNVVSMDDLRQLMATARFWGIDELPSTVHEFVLFHTPSIRYKHDRVMGIVTEYQKEFPILSILEAVRETSVADRVVKSAELGSLQTLRVLLKNGYAVPETTTVVAAENGHVDCLRLAYDVLSGTKRKPFKNMAPWRVALNGHLACLQFLVEKRVRLDKNVCRAAAESGHLDCLKYAHDHRAPWDSVVCKVAAAGGHLSCLAYALDHNCPLHKETALEAIQHDCLAVLEYVLDRPGARSPKLCARASELGKLEYLQLAHTKGCRLTNAVVHLAALNGHLHCLQYAHTHKCPYDVSALVPAAEHNHWECVIFLLQRDAVLYLHDFCVHALRKDDPSFLQHLVTGGIELNRDLCESAASEGALKCLQYLYEIDCFDRDAYACAGAAENGHLSCLQFAHEHGCQWSEEDCRCAAEGGWLPCLQYLHTHGCPWNEDTCTLAAETGHLDCLVYAHDQGCPWGAAVCETAAANNQLDCLRYALEHACPRGVETTTAAAREGHLACLRLARAHGCPWDATASEGAEWDFRTLRYCVSHGCPLSAATMQAYNDLCARYAQLYSAESEDGRSDDETWLDCDFQRSEDSRSACGNGGSSGSSGGGGGSGGGQQGGYRAPLYGFGFGSGY